jgi:hypothetical protein
VVSLASSGSLRYFRQVPYTRSIYRWYREASTSKLPEVLYASSKSLSDNVDGMFLRNANLLKKNLCNYRPISFIYSCIWTIKLCDNHGRHKVWFNNIEELIWMPHHIPVCNFILIAS